MRYMILFILFVGCGGGGDTTSSQKDSVVAGNIVNESIPRISLEDNVSVEALSKVSISGKITYDRVHPKSNYIGLNYSNITQEPAKQVLIQLIDINNSVIASTTSNNDGEYRFLNLDINQSVKVRVFAKLYQQNTAIWDVKVVDNTNNNALYVMEGLFVNVDEQNSIRNLNASKEQNIAAPFALLDTIYLGMQKILEFENDTSFPPLLVHWSINNTTSSGKISDGQISTSYYTDGKMFILGDINGDNDEYDDHVVAHEWAHYYEDKFSRSDSIGGTHSPGDYLDIRVAFGEGFGNAMSAISTDNPIYFDSFISGDSSIGWSMDIESGNQQNSGWYSEASIHRILYDLYDSNNEGSDHVSLGFSPLHNIFIGAEKNTEAFTSIFSFITALKNENPDEINAIDLLLSEENIARVIDIYGTNRKNLSTETVVYSLLSVDGTINVCTQNAYGSFNKLNNHKYIRFDINNSADYSIRIHQTNGSDSDPDFRLFNAKPYRYIATVENELDGEEFGNIGLEFGSYLLDVFDYRNKENSCFDITITII